MNAVRPVIRQFGSKARVAPWLLALVPSDTTAWVEVFCGTASVTLAKDPAAHREEHLNDLNGDIIGLFAVLRDPARRDALCDLVALTPWSEAEYRACRHDPVTGDAVEDARRFLVRSWQGMNGASVRHTSWVATDRASKNRPAVWRDMPDKIAVVAQRLMRVALHSRPADQLVARFDGYGPGAMLFVDPPYPQSSVNSRHGYAVCMSDDEHEAFAHQLHGCNARVLLTMSEGTVYDEILADWWQLPLPVRGLRNTVKNERVYMNYSPDSLGLFAERGVA